MTDTEANNTANKPSGSAPSTASDSAEQPRRDGPVIRALSVVEVLGNKLPDPFWLFVILAGIVVALSSLMANLGVTAVNPADGEEVAIQNLLTSEGAQRMLGEAVENFATFPPLGVVITVLLGVAVAERTGLINTAVKLVVSRVSAGWLTFVLALAGVTGSIASDAIVVVLIPLGAAAFKAAGRSAVLGAVIAFVSSSAGFNASLLVNLTDPLLGGITQSAAQLVDPEYTVSPIANYFFSAASAVVLALTITLVSELVLTKLAKRFETHELSEDEASDRAEQSSGDEAATMTSENLTVTSKREIKGLYAALVALAIGLAIYFTLMFMPNTPFPGEDGTPLTSVLISGVAVPIALLFFLCGAVYGWVAGTLKNFSEIPSMMASAITQVAPLIVLFFAASQFIAWFGWSNMGTVLAIKGSEFLGDAGVPTVVLFAGLVLIVAVLNILITSGSAQWTLTAPVVVPMFMYLSIPPETTQMLFRIGDSPSNVVSPLNPFFAMTLGFMQRWYPKAGIGTLMSLTIPVSIAMLVVWFLFFLAWWGLGIPLGPGSPTR
ncbi:MAG: AbgT family transporter [Kocuria sp.]|uniref:AbgT family transporter n=1 Tax=Kocuria carniphila TaxID=262208 RepID=UPI0021A6296F|nr:AbgT family transporter [Kocuria carniphila]MCT1802831.1 AbgT family transporter [Kocuria carniphila]MDN5700758.1 AbgT family transporter [Kocuria sp.]